MKLIALSTLAAFATASPAALDTRQSGPVTLYPTTLSLWNSGTSTVTFDTSYGLIQRYPGSKNEISTLFTFSIPSQYANNKCELVFTTLTADSDVSGTGQGQVFFSQRAARAGATSDFRDNQVATIQAKDDSVATFGGVDGSGANPTFKIDCAKLIAKPYLEVAPRGERDSIYFPKGDGLKIVVS